MAAGMFGCISAERPTQNVVVVCARSMVPLVSDLAARFQKSHRQVRIDIEPGLADRIVSDTRQGLADVGFLGRSLRPEETGIRGVVIGHDGIAFVVHRSNPLQRLNEAHLVGLLTRVYTTWKDVGGLERPVRVVGVGEGRGLREVLLDQFALRPGNLRPDPAYGTSEQVLQAVANQPAALGYVSLGAAETFASNQPIRLLPYQDVPATLENVRNRSYSLVRNLLVLTRANPNGPVGEFLDFVRSPDVHDLINKHGFVQASK
jgi:phosphate transport system substrate-binding protein